jgi:predicted lipid carrier protein YhbT
MNIPSFDLPARFARIGRALPQWPHSLALAQALNAAIRLGKLDAQSLAPLAGRSVSIECRDAGATATVRFDGARFSAARAAADLVISAPLSALARIATRQDDPDTLFFHRRLQITGDTELGLVVKNLLDSIELPAWLSAAH